VSLYNIEMIAVHEHIRFVHKNMIFDIQYSYTYAFNLCSQSVLRVLRAIIATAEICLFMFYTSPVIGDTSM